MSTLKRLPLLVFLVGSTVLAQTPSGTINGQVLTREGQPAVGVRVRAMAASQPGVSFDNATALVRLTFTDSSGRYRLENVPPGRYFVMAGFVEYYPGVPSDSARTVQVAASAPVADISIPMVVGTATTGVAGADVGGGAIFMPVAAPPSPLQNGSISGRVLDKDGVTPVQGATVVIDSFVSQNGQIQVRERLTTITSRDGRYSLTGVYTGRARVTAIANNHTGVVRGEVLGDELFVAGGVDTQVDFDLSKPGPAGPSSLIPRPLPPPPPPPRIGGDVAQANLIFSVPPVYPPPAREARVEGAVLLQATIGTDGAVQGLRVITGHPLLDDAAIDAVRQWRFRPQTLAGQPISVVTTITVNFTLQ